MPGWQRLRFDFGGYYLARRTNGTIYRCRYDPGRRQVDRIHLGTADLESAKAALIDHVQLHGELQQADPRAVPVAQCLARYYEHHASRLPSADQARIAIGQVPASRPSSAAWLPSCPLPRLPKRFTAYD
jgi:hypothetical protein